LSYITKSVIVRHVFILRIPLIIREYYFFRYNDIFLIITKGVVVCIAFYVFPIYNPCCAIGIINQVIKAIIFNDSSLGR